MGGEELFDEQAAEEGRLVSVRGDGGDQVIAVGVSENVAAEQGLVKSWNPLAALSGDERP